MILVYDKYVLILNILLFYFQNTVLKKKNMLYLFNIMVIRKNSCYKTIP